MESWASCGTMRYAVQDSSETKIVGEEVYDLPRDNSSTDSMAPPLAVYLPAAPKPPPPTNISVPAGSRQPLPCPSETSIVGADVQLKPLILGGESYPIPPYAKATALNLPPTTSNVPAASPLLKSKLPLKVEFPVRE